MVAVRGEQFLTRRDQFGLVYEKGGTLANNTVVIKTLPNDLGLSRYGITVSKRVGKAVVRNRVKRLFREILRQTQIKPGWDIVFIARPAAVKTDYDSLGKSVRHLLFRAGL